MASEESKAGSGGASRPVEKTLNQYVPELRPILEKAESELDTPAHRSELAEAGHLPTVKISLEGCTYVLTRILDTTDRTNLSPRQKEIANLCLAGLQRRDMALKLGISARTVDTHMERLCVKFRVDSRTQLIQKMGMDKMLGLLS